jgi:S-adenosylmethionine decarboxylase
MNGNVYGPHLMIDGRSNSSAMKSAEKIYKILFDLPDIIGMKKITTPYVVPYVHEIKEESGISGVVMIAESHISIHTYPHKDYVFIDIFSCKEFSTKKAIDFLKEKLGLTKMKTYLEQRGKDFPRTVMAEAVINT